LVEQRITLKTVFEHTAYLSGLYLQHSHYYVRIARFMPRVEIIQKHNTAARRLYIRGHNGKVGWWFLDKSKVLF